MTGANAKIKRILVRPNGVEKQVRPNYIEYDFTQGSQGWTASSGTSRDSSGFYRSGTYTDGWIVAPTSMFNLTPKKLILTYNKLGASCGTGLSENSIGQAIHLPRDPSYLNIVGFYSNGSYSNLINLGGNPTGLLEWEITIDKSTTPRTLNHKIGTYSFTDTSGYIDRMRSDKEIAIRIVNWDYNNGMHLQKFKVVF